MQIDLLLLIKMKKAFDTDSGPPLSNCSSFFLVQQPNQLLFGEVLFLYGSKNARPLLEYCQL